MKKIMNSPETMVNEMCNGFVNAHSDIEYINKFKILKKRNINKNKVTLISGGGSGHEPAHGGFIGKGMLDAAVCGDVFASPSQIQVYEGILNTKSDKGTLLIIKNYSGDIMNFKNASIMAQEDGIKVDYVTVNDDIAVQDSLYTVGRRGVAGTIFVHKIAGAASERGLELEEVKRLSEKAINNVRSIGFAYTSCTVPAKGSPTFVLADDEMEYGVGIHGEPGIKREKIISANDISKRMVESILKDFGDIKSEDEVAVLINGFGATPLQELYLLNSSVGNELNNHNIKVVKTLVGNFMTSIDMAGASISILKLDDELKQFLEDECITPALNFIGKIKYTPFIPLEKLEKSKNIISYEVETNSQYAKIENEKISINNMIYIVDKMSECIIKNEIPFCELDSFAGDGDFGMSVAKGFKQLKSEWKEITETKSSTIGEFLNACSIVIMEHCGGASGPIWGSAFRGAGKTVRNSKSLTVLEFAEMLQAAATAIQVTGERSFGRGAVVGDKTLIDALVPCVDSWFVSDKNNLSFKEAFKEGVLAAVEGAEKTKTIAAKMGRAGTVGDRSIGHPDAGAFALGVIFAEIASSLI